jgi:hypothetical protein
MRESHHCVEFSYERMPLVDELVAGRKVELSHFITPTLQNVLIPTQKQNKKQI